MAAPVFVADELVTAAKMNQLPKGWLGSVKVTANQTGISTEVDLTGLTVTATGLPAGRRVKVTGYLIVQQLTAVSNSQVRIYRDATQIGQATASLAVNDFYPFHIVAYDTPSAGSPVYKLRGATSGGTYTLNASATLPALILVEDIGAV